MKIIKNYITLGGLLGLFPLVLCSEIGSPLESSSSVHDASPFVYKSHSSDSLNSQASTEIIQYLLETGSESTIPEVNRRDNNGNTSLMRAAQRGQVATVKALLLVPFIDVNILNNNGYTALMLAALYGRTEVLKALMSSPLTHINTANSTGYTALLFAAMGGKSEAVIELLKDPFIDVNSADHLGNTALMFAANQSNIHMLKSLLAVPTIRINQTNQAGYTALMIAQMKNDIPLIEVFLSHQQGSPRESNHLKNPLWPSNNERIRRKSSLEALHLINNAHKNNSPYKSPKESYDH